MNSNRAIQLGLWSSIILALLNAVYLALLVVEFSTQGFAFPPPPMVQLVAGVITLLTVPTMLVLFAAIKHVSPKEDAILGTLGLSFAILFAAAVSINRFVQLTVIRQATPADLGGDLKRFLPYADGSIMLALELLGWGFFIPMAALSIAPLFRSNRLGLSIRWTLVAIAALSFVGVAGYAAASPISGFGFLAWGPLLLVLAILLALFFYKLGKTTRTVTGEEMGGIGKTQRQ